MKHFQCCVLLTSISLRITKRKVRLYGLVNSCANDSVRQQEFIRKVTLCQYVKGVDLQGL